MEMMMLERREIREKRVEKGCLHQPFLWHSQAIPDGHI